MSRALRVVPAERASQRGDGACVRRVAAGDLGALAELFDCHASAVRGFARRLGSADDADDITQAVFLRVMEIAERFEPATVAARPWLFGISVQIVKERRRSFARWARTLAAFGERPSGVARLHEHDAEVRAALLRLTLEKRAVLVMAEIEGMTGEEIAAALAIPVGTVWTRLHHARREMRAHLEGV